MRRRAATDQPDLRLRLLGAALRRIAPVTAAATAEQLARMRARPPDDALVRLINGTPARDVRIDERRVQGRAAEIPLVVYRPPDDGDLPVVVFLHGGGWVISSGHHNPWLCSQVASRVGAVVVSVGYRLAPEHRFPAAVDDAWDGLVWTAGHARELGADPERLAVMGDSAGGNLAAVVSQQARDEGGPCIRHQTLIYPSTDLRHEHAPGPEHDRAVMLPRRDRLAYRAHYLGDWTDLADPRLSPICAPSLAGLPPALVITAEHDPLRDEGRRYADRLADAGVDVRLTDYVGMAHGFLSVPGLASGARQALDEICQVLSAAL